MWSTQKKVIIVTGLLVLLSGFGGGAYAYVDYQNKMQEEQGLQAVKVAEETISAFYIDEKKVELAEDISEENLAEAREKIDAVNDTKIAKILTKDLKEIEILWNARERVQSFLEDGKLVEGGDEKQIANLSKLIIEVKEINKAFA